MKAADHEFFMRQALEAAARAWGGTHPNPMVGAVIVESGVAVAEGLHVHAGMAHAEANAFHNLGRRPRDGAILYVTLEPCCTHGRTPPCTDAIIASGIRHVVVGTEDPNPKHSGRGFEVLRESGISVETGVLADECADMNLIFNHWIKTCRPLVAAKIATSLDGRIAARTGESKWITGAPARLDVMRWRRLFPAIAVGSGTIFSDDPRLTARVADGEFCPVRFVFDGRLGTASMNPQPQVFSDEFAARTVLVTVDSSKPSETHDLELNGVCVWRLPSRDGEVDMDAFLDRCASESITGVFVEGGSRTISGLLRDKRIDYLFSYRAPLVFADEMAIPMASGLRTDSPAGGVRLEDVRHAVFGDDQLIRGWVRYPDVLPIDEAAVEHEKRHRRP